MERRLCGSAISRCSTSQVPPCRARGAIVSGNIEFAKTLVSMALPKNFANPDRPLAPNNSAAIVNEILSRDPRSGALTDLPLPIRVSYLRSSISRPLTGEERSEIGVPVGRPSARLPGNSWSECNALSADPFDPEVHEARVPWDLLDYQASIETCQRALADRPATPQLLSISLRGHNNAGRSWNLTNSEGRI